MSFLAELKRRNVVRVGIAYVVIGWLLAQVGEFAFENFGAPEWVLKSFVALLLLGLPIALIFAWAFEMTPEGIKREKDVVREESITSQTGRKLDRLIIAVLVIAVALLTWDKISGDGEDTPEMVDIQSIAVLPFANMSDDSDHFADGLTEELLNLLAQNHELKVAGRTSSFAFKGRNEDLREIGQSLGVEKVLEGSVRRSGDRIRITAQLINVEDGFHLWSDTYDSELIDLFDVQDRVAGAITQALQLHLTPEAKRYTENADAYALYLEARALSSFNSLDDINLAVDLLQRATTLDPQFAKAYELMSFFYWMRAGWDLPAQEGQLMAHNAALAAIAIDPTLSSARSLSITTNPNDWNWIKELAALKELVSKDRSIRALDTYGYDLMISGYFREAEAIFREQLDRDPLSINAWTRIAEISMIHGRIEEAFQAHQKSIDLGNRDRGGLAIGYALVTGDDATATQLLEYEYDPDYFGFATPAEFVAAMRDPLSGRQTLELWIEGKLSQEQFVGNKLWAQSFALWFGHMDLYLEQLAYHGEIGLTWNDSELLEHWGVVVAEAGYRTTQTYLDRAEAGGLFQLWEHRGPPDHCSKETGEWVCQ